jgi:hypothetical protein
MKINLKKLNIILIILVTVMLSNSSSFGYVKENKDLPKYEMTEDEQFNKIFREGRDLIDKEEWKKASEKFNEIVCDCPGTKGVDAALYWLAFCYKKQNMRKQMDETLVRLLRSFPSSSWADDARVMQYDQISTTAGLVSKATLLRTGQRLNFPSEINVNTIFSNSSQAPLDREDEIKLAAFQSLFSANPQRAISVIGEMLQKDSKASETLKSMVIRTLRTPRFFTVRSSPGSSIYEVPAAVKADNQYLPQIRETLVKGYQTESSVKVRSEIIYALASLNDDESNTYIAQLYSSEQNKELKKAIINSVSGSHYYSGWATAARQPHSKKGNFEKLLEIIRTEKDSELRRLALSNLRQFTGWSAKDGVIETLSQMYDSENDEEFKISIIRTFAATKKNEAAMKLLSIAKTDKSDKMRLEAIRSLNNSDNPEILKFLEDLIK